MVGSVLAALRRLTSSVHWLILSVVLLNACAAPLSPVGSATVELDVFTAASLAAAFAEIGPAFAAQEPGVEVRLNVAGSQTLAQQINSGAPADVFASADERQMQAVIAGGRVEPESARAFAGNRLAIILPADSPKRIDGLSDLAQPGVALVLAAEEVPVGAYSRQIIRAAAGHPGFEPDFERRVLANVVSLEEIVSAVMTKVALGEADAGIVYTSDASGDPAVRWVRIPDELNVEARYYLAAVAGGPEEALAERFVDFVLGETGQAILVEYGFEPVSE